MRFWLLRGSRVVLNLVDGTSLVGVLDSTSRSMFHLVEVEVDGERAAGSWHVNRAHVVALQVVD